MLGRVWRIDAAYQLLNLEAVDAEIAQIAQLADSTRLPLARWHLLRQQASRAALAGQLAIARDRSGSPPACLPDPGPVRCGPVVRIRRLAGGPPR